MDGQKEERQRVWILESQLLLRQYCPLITVDHRHGRVLKPSTGALKRGLKLKVAVE